MTSQEFEQLYVKGFARTQSTLRSRGVPEDLQEEVAQEAWTRAWEHREECSGTFQNWVNTIAWHFYVDQHRKNKLVFIPMRVAVPRYDGRILLRELLTRLFHRSPNRYATVLRYLRDERLKKVEHLQMHRICKAWRERLAV